MLPLILKRAMILVAVCAAALGMIAFCAGMWGAAEGEDTKLRIGYVAEDNKLTQFAVSYVQNMESVKSLCNLEPVTQEEGRRLVESGDLAALIVLPEDVINEILSGSNTPAKLYVHQDSNTMGGGLSAVGSMLFEELALAGIGMLDMAQAQIYAVSDVLNALQIPYDSDILQAMYDDINQFNLSVATNREMLFRTKSVSVTGNDTYVVYYVSAALTIYAMLAGLFFGSFCKRSYMQQAMAEKRIGVSLAKQLADRCLAGTMLMFMTLALPFAAFLIPGVNSLLSVQITPGGIISLFLITIFMTVYNMLIYQMVEKRESALVMIGLMAVLQSYLSGCLIPSALLPKVASAVGAVLPAAYLKAGFTILLTGDARKLSQIVTGLLLWGIVLFAMTLLLMRLGDRSGGYSHDRKVHGKRHVPSVCTVMLKRTLHKKSIWICMAVVAALSIIMVEAEKDSETEITAAVYDETGEYAALLESYEGLVDFAVMESDEQVIQAVLRGEAECGYVLPTGLTENIMTYRANRSVTVYQDADTVIVPIVNEVIFEQIFDHVSLRWFEDYLTQNSFLQEKGVSHDRIAALMDDSMDRQLTSGVTFGFEIEHVGNGAIVSQEQQQASYPVAGVMIIAVILCGLQGTVQVIADIRDRRFYKRNRVAMSAVTILLPVLLGIFAGILTKLAVFLLTL